MKKRINRDASKTISFRVPLIEYKKLQIEADRLNMSLSDFVWTKMNTVAPPHLRQLLILYNAFTDVDYSSMRGKVRYEDINDVHQNIYDLFSKLMEDLFGEETWYDPNDKGVLKKIADSISDDEYDAIVGDFKT